MTTSVLIIAHAPLASALKQCAVHVFSHDERTAGCITTVDVAADADVNAVSEEIAAALPSEPNGCVVLIDIAGASPANVAASLVNRPHTVVLTGANLPMVLTAVCHRDGELQEVARLVREAGAASIAPLTAVAD